MCFAVLSPVTLGLAIPCSAGEAQAPTQATPVTTASPPPSAPAQRSKAELEKLVMPIALHPDPLISIILPAAAYPLEIVQAARFVKDTNNIPKVKQQAWDDNVKAVAELPDLIAKMDSDLSWTVALGQAFIDQPKELMDTIQELRAKAQKAGTLRTTAQQIVTVTNVVVVQTNVAQVVTVTNQIVQVQPANPQVVYVPTYPTTVYYPPPSYVYDPYAPLVTFGVGIAIGAIIANNCDWHGGCVWVGGGGYHGDVDIDIDRTVNRGDRNVNRGDRPAQQAGNRAAGTAASPRQQKWQPDQNRLRSSGGGVSAATSDARGWGGGANRPGQSSGTAGAARASSQPSYNWSQRASSAQQSGRGSASAQSPAVSQRQGAASVNARPTSTWQQSGAGRPSASQGGPSQSLNRSPSQSSSAFSGVGTGSSTRSASSRGAMSRGGAGFGGGGRGGGRGR
jgi:hypothetical protein